MKALIVTILGIILATAAGLVNIPWLAGLAALVTLAGAWAQYRDGLPFERVFSSADWRRQTDPNFQLVVPFGEHKKSSPIVAVYLGQPPAFELIGCEVATDANGGVVLGASHAFAGKVVVR